MNLPVAASPQLAATICHRSAPTAEEWRDVVGFEAHYQVSSWGRVGHRETGRVLRPWIAAHRYHYVHLCRTDYRRKVGVHVLVAEAFLGPKPSPRHEVAHWDGVGTNNAVTNLRWATHAENVQDQRRHGTLHPPRFRGSSHPRARLREEDVLRLRGIYSGRRGELTQLARFYDIHPSTLKRAVVGDGWTHL